MTVVFQIRPASSADLNALVDLEFRGFTADRFTRRQFRHLLTRANSTVLVLEHRRRPIGAAVMLWRRNSTVGRLYDIVVDPQCRGKGFGARLLRASEVEAKRHGCVAVSLEVRTDNRSAVALYHKHGYEIVDSLPGYYEDGASGLRMAKRLRKPPARTAS